MASVEENAIPILQRLLRWQLKMHFIAKLRKIGGSVGIIIPYEVIEKLKLKEGKIEEFDIFEKDKE